MNKSTEWTTKWAPKWKTDQTIEWTNGRTNGRTKEWFTFDWGLTGGSTHAPSLAAEVIRMRYCDEGNHFDSSSLRETMGSCMCDDWERVMAAMTYQFQYVPLSDYSSQGRPRVSSPVNILFFVCFTHRFDLSRNSNLQAYCCDLHYALLQISLRITPLCCQWMQPSYHSSSLRYINPSRQIKKWIVML